MLSIAVLAVASVQAQDNERLPVVNKKGQNILPAAGDFSISIDAAPFFYYFGNMFNQNDDNESPSVEEYGGVGIYGKYFLRNDRAIRVGFDWQTTVSTKKGLVADDGRLISQPEVINPTAFDVKKHHESDFTFTVGYEFRRGYKRLQAFYGAQVGFGFSKETEKYKYANAITDLNQAPSTYNFGNNILSTNPTTRTLSKNYGTYYYMGVGAFVGVEYFIAPKVSLGGEFTLNFYANIGKQRVETTEVWDANLGARQEVTKRSSGNSGSNLRFETSPYGSIFLAFYF